MKLPKLKINKTLYGNRSVPTHTLVEQIVAWKLLLKLEKIGFKVVSIDDGEEKPHRVYSKKGAMELMFNLDDCIVNFFKDKEKYTLQLVFGNALDILSDWGIRDSVNGTLFDTTLDAYNEETEQPYFLVEGVS